ncbi:winged helix-turn-helix transcriptional regulator [Maritimibacter dapengensis]|uniref:Helix-turn-helix transcriptional regulator n=1 Tax=Maritimibacter dapengensis TaxID=2836868 RepID=A0ABS6T5Q3_9RHOB|nr:helix-turn-helix domain-containing protein [Maritimibacter dapengensis]MBV7380608.1 helix-turn-helix transcriptional regulator [Maritimibacter dapengensis]
MLTADDLAKLLAIGEAEVLESDPRLAGLAALSDAMGATPPDRDAPVREVMARLGDNWSALILKVLATGTYRHATLRRVIGALASEQDISQRMLTLRLKALERDGLITRRESRSVPPRVEYALSPLGRDLVSEFDRLLGWLEAHSSQIAAARERFKD